MIYHLRCLWKGVVTIFPSLFTAFAIGNFLYLGIEALASFRYETGYPWEKASFPMVVVVIQMLRFIRDVGECELEAGN